jgi:ketosteroid isomerase-like protein
MCEEPASPDLVERTRHSLEGGASRDLVEGLTYFAPDAVWEAPQLGIRFEGAAAIRGFLEDWFDAFKDFEIELQETFSISATEGVRRRLVGWSSGR